MVKVLMVCLGNICRSPLAEGILREKIRKNNIDAIVESCGFEKFHVGEGADNRATHIARINKVDISNHRARLFNTSFFDYYDKILVMDENNYRMVMAKARNEGDKLKVDYIMNLNNPGLNKPVPDPYYGDIEHFDATFRMLDTATDKIVELLKTNQWL